MNKYDEDRCFWIEQNKEDILGIIDNYEKSYIDGCERLGQSPVDDLDKEIWLGISKLKNDINNLTMENIKSGDFKGLARIDLLKKILEWWLNTQTDDEGLKKIVTSGLKEFF